MTPSKIYLAGAALLSLMALIEGGVAACAGTAGGLLIVFASVRALAEFDL